MKGMKLALAALVVMALTCGGLGVAPAVAGRAAVLEVKVTHRAVSQSSFHAGDDERHFIGVGQREGEAVFNTGETARYSNVFTFDAYPGRPVPSEGYTKFLFADGSWFALSWQARTVTGKDGLSVSEGQGTILKGTGRYEGIKGTAVFSGRELRPASQDPGRTTVMNATITCTLP